MRYVVAIVIGIVIWYLLTIGLGVAWGIFGIPYNPAHSTLFNLILLPISAYLSAGVWRIGDASNCKRDRVRL